MKLSTLDCPVNCPYLMLETWGCGCDYGFVPGAPIVERIGGDAVIEEGKCQREQKK